MDGSALGSSIVLPTAVSGSQARLTFSGTATSEGTLTTSGDGHYVMLGGYDADLGTTAIASSSATRVIGRIDRAHHIDTSTQLGTAFAANNIRGACSSDGAALWAVGSNGGLVYTPFGATSNALQIVAAPTNQRGCNVFFGQLYGVASAQTYYTVFSIGSGTPTTSPQTATALSGLDNVVGQSNTSFVLIDSNGNNVPDLLYTADDRLLAAGGGIYKWTSTDGVNWVAGTPAVTAESARNLAGYYANGQVNLIVTSPLGTGNTISRVTDDMSGDALTATVLVTAPANTGYRGVAIGPR